jgi:uncharacterized protein YndB with AHSA1/START domain
VATVGFSTTIARKTEEVFDLVADIRRNREWAPGFTGAEKTSAGPIGPDATFHTVARGMGDLQIRIREYERPSRLGFVGNTRSAAIDHHFTLTPEGQGTLVDQRIEVRPKGALLRLMAPLMAVMLKRQIQSNTSALKQYLERTA